MAEYDLIFSVVVNILIMLGCFLAIFIAGMRKWTPDEANVTVHSGVLLWVKFSPEAVSQPRRSRRLQANVVKMEDVMDDEDLADTKKTQ